MKLSQLQDKILSIIVENTNFSLFEIGQAYKRLKSFDKLLSYIARAREEGRGMESVVDEMEGTNGN